MVGGRIRAVVKPECRGLTGRRGVEVAIVAHLHVHGDHLLRHDAVISAKLLQSEDSARAIGSAHQLAPCDVLPNGRFPHFMLPTGEGAESFRRRKSRPILLHGAEVVHARHTLKGETQVTAQARLHVVDPSQVGHRPETVVRAEIERPLMGRTRINVDGQATAQKSDKGVRIEHDIPLQIAPRITSRREMDPPDFPAEQLRIAVERGGDGP